MTDFGAMARQIGTKRDEMLDMLMRSPRCTRAMARRKEFPLAAIRFRCRPAYRCPRRRRAGPKAPSNFRRRDCRYLGVHIVLPFPEVPLNVSFPSSPYITSSAPEALVRLDCTKTGGANAVPKLTFQTDHSVGPVNDGGVVTRCKRVVQCLAMSFGLSRYLLSIVNCAFANASIE